VRSPLSKLLSEDDAEQSERSTRESSARRFRDDRRGVSKALGYVLGVAIITMLLSGLIIATSNVVEDAADRGTEAELQVAGDQLAGKVMEVDRVADSESNTEVTVRANVQARAGGSQYRVDVDPSEDQLILESTSKDVSVVIPVKVQSDLEDRSATSGDLYVALRYDAVSGDPVIHIVTEDQLSAL
jgi:hypothetical protein